MKQFVHIALLITSMSLLSSCTVTTGTYTPTYSTYAVDVIYPSNYWGTRYWETRYYPGTRYYNSSVYYGTRVYKGYRW